MFANFKAYTRKKVIHLRLGQGNEKYMKKRFTSQHATQKSLAISFHCFRGNSAISFRQKWGHTRPQATCKQRKPVQSGFLTNIKTLLVRCSRTNFVTKNLDYIKNHWKYCTYISDNFLRVNSPRNPVAAVPNARMIAWPKRCAPECTRDPLNMHRARADQMMFTV